LDINENMGKAEIHITKASGEIVPFSADKLRLSLERAGAPDNQIEQVIQEIVPQLFPGITTKRIYHLAFKKLKNLERHLAGKYQLKKAIMNLGPSGFPFEKFISELFHFQGYTVEVGVFVPGKCVNHEVDVFAQKDGKKYLVECKYHNGPGTVSNVKIPLYIQARFEDINANPAHRNKELQFTQAWVVTNTKFTDDAIRYGNCAGLKLIGWNYPDIGSLRNLIDHSGLYPITCLTTLTQTEKKILLENKIVLCTDVLKNPDKLSVLKIDLRKRPRILEEIKNLCISQEPDQSVI